MSDEQVGQQPRSRLQGLRLHETERALLVAGEEPQAQVDAAWATEIERRVREMTASSAGLRGADEVFAGLRRHLEQRRRGTGAEGPNASLCRSKL